MQHVCKWVSKPAPKTAASTMFIKCETPRILDREPGIASTKETCTVQFATKSHADVVCLFPCRVSRCKSPVITTARQTWHLQRNFEPYRPSGRNTMMADMSIEPALQFLSLSLSLSLSVSLWHNSFVSHSSLIVFIFSSYVSGGNTADKTPGDTRHSLWDAQV